MSTLTTPCLVCSHPASPHQHYGAVCCYSCRAFFRRSVWQRYECVSGDNQCEVDKITRTNCKSCRYQKCVSVGMDRQSVDVNKKWKKQNRRKERINVMTDTHIETEVELSQPVDIINIVEECFQEEQNKEKQQETFNHSNPINFICGSQIQLNVEQKHSPICFTLEEEFRVHDLIAKREFMNDIFAQIKNDAISTIDTDSMITKTKEGKWSYGKKLMHASQTLSQHIGSARFHGVYDEFRNVKKDTAFEYHYKSFPALLALFEAIMEGTKNLSIAEQYRVLGSSQKLIKTLPNMKGIGMDDQEHFKSPWAHSIHDEEYFRQTINQLGKLICPDVSLCSLYYTLIMCSYNMFTTEQDRDIKTVQTNTTILLYRYLASKMGTEGASEMVSMLEGFIEKLHRCGYILFNRIRMTDAIEDENDEIHDSAGYSQNM